MLYYGINQVKIKKRIIIIIIIIITIIIIIIIIIIDLARELRKLWNRRSKQELCLLLSGHLEQSQND